MKTLGIHCRMLVATMSLADTYGAAVAHNTHISPKMQRFHPQCNAIPLYPDYNAFSLFPVCLAGEEIACVCVFHLNLCKNGVTVATGCGSIHRQYTDFR